MTLLTQDGNGIVQEHRDRSLEVLSGSIAVVVAGTGRFQKKCGSRHISMRGIYHFPQRQRSLFSQNVTQV